MSTYQPKPDTWTLFPNKFKKDGNHPDFSGTALLTLPDGTQAEYKLTAWKRVTKTDVKFIGGFIKIKEPQKELLPETEAGAGENPW
jgi:hypothetical protein